MSHEPPVPPGNQSPYPTQEPPHTPSVTPVTVAKVVHPTPQQERTTPARRHRVPIGAIAGAAVGAGAIVFGVAALLFPRGGDAKRRKGGRKR